jgi:AraC family ethanolamine operon transcriptional activator
MVTTLAAPKRSTIPDAWSGDDVAPYSVARVTSTDIEEQAASLDGWNQVYEQMTPGPFVGKLHELRFAGVQLFRETSNQAVHECGTLWPGSRAVGVPVAMDGTALFRGQPTEVDALVTLGPDEELDFYAPRGLDILGLAIDADVLEAHARQVEHRDIAAVFGTSSVFSPGAARLDEFRRVLLSVLQALDANPTALQFGQAQRVLEQTMLGAVVAVVNDDTASPDLAHPRRRHIVDSAKEFMRARITETITVADLCIALGVSRRTLQYSFKEVLGINPVRFLRAMRLNGVRRDLKNVGERARSVQDAAANWGFWHLGHFVTEYKQMFGELPSATMRRNRRPAAGARS